jgi:hypothetical protein
MPRDDQDDAEVGPALTRDTLADKTMRFGCGAALGVLIAVAVVLAGLGEPFGLTGALIGGVVFAAVCGVLGLAYGNRFLEGLVRMAGWL